MTQPLRVGMAGLGTVGCGVVQLLIQDAPSIAKRAGRSILLARVASRTPKAQVDLGDASFDTDLCSLTDADDVDVVVECIGGEDAAKGLFEAAIDASKHFVTANKALIALHGNELLGRAHGAGIRVGFEAAVAGGIPIINALTRGLTANRIEWLAGIINGTSNYILTAMSRDGQDFGQALADAQRLGYAEPDPTFDVEGIDAAHKLAILAALAFDTPLRVDAVYTEGIGGVDVEDIQYARELGYQIKHLGIARRREGGVETRVHPTLVPDDWLIAKVDGVLNAVMVNGHAVGSTIYVGPGAGALPTASAVVADLVELARGDLPVPGRFGAELPALAVDTIEAAYYLNIPAADQPGVFAEVAEILSRDGISIEAVIQRPQAIRDSAAASEASKTSEASEASETWVPIVILTNEIAERTMDRSQDAIQRLDHVRSNIRRIRVANFA